MSSTRESMSSSTARKTFTASDALAYLVPRNSAAHSAVKERSNVWLRSYNVPGLNPWRGRCQRGPSPVLVYSCNNLVPKRNTSKHAIASDKDDCTTWLRNGVHFKCFLFPNLRTGQLILKGTEDISPIWISDNETHGSTLLQCASYMLDPVTYLKMGQDPSYEFELRITDYMRYQLDYAVLLVEYSASINDTTGQFSIDVLRTMGATQSVELLHYNPLGLEQSMARYLDISLGDVEILHRLVLPADQGKDLAESDMVLEKCSGDDRCSAIIR